MLSIFSSSERVGARLPLEGLGSAVAGRARFARGIIGRDEPDGVFSFPPEAARFRFDFFGGEKGESGVRIGANGLP